MEPASRFTLDNGMRFVVAENHVAPVAAVGLAIDVGVCDEPADRRGIAHFFEHMMFRGSRQVGPEEHARTIARMGGDCNAFTSFDATVYHQTVPGNAVEETFRLEADRFRYLQLRAELVDIERRVILEELEASRNQPLNRAMQALREEISGDHPYALDPLGRRRDVEEISADDLESFYGRSYRPNRVVAVVSGDITLARVQDLAAQYFGPWRATPPDSGRPAAPAYQTLVGSLSRRVPVEVPMVAQVYRTAPLGQVDKPGLNLLVALLSSGASSPLRQALVRDRHLCVEAGCMNMLGTCGGLVAMFGAFLPPGRHAVRRGIIKQLVGDLAERGPDPEQFARHLKRFRKGRARDGYSCHKRMLGLAFAELLEGGFERYDRELEALSRVDAGQIQKLAKALFAPENSLELDVAPERTRWWMLPAGILAKVWPR